MKLIKEFYWFVGTVCLITLGSLGVVYFLSSKNASSTVIWIFAVVPVATWIIVFVEYLRIFGAGLDFVKRWEREADKKNHAKNWEGNLKVQPMEMDKHALEGCIKCGK
ncbi:hypothetical protein QSE00_07595 [Arenibacter sp. M-2]|uniref:hypothetical protein n=1 Tax=Arenibacter sp. M-2 TaxID=3053612 RepID=UPI002570AF52|nr:hypothetical protein [Arenibacter sp. M-2]MDL5511668.1 hypothetical protein [Arenibacter sp. M-2]